MNNNIIKSLRRTLLCTDAAAAVELVQIVFKFCAEGRVADGVDLPAAALLPVPDGHAAVARAEMAVIVRPEKHVHDHIAAGHRAEEAAHYAKKSSESVIGSMYWPSL